MRTIVRHRCALPAASSAHRGGRCYPNRAAAAATVTVHSFFIIVTESRRPRGKKSGRGPRVVPNMISSFMPHHAILRLRERLAVAVRERDRERVGVGEEDARL